MSRLALQNPPPKFAAKAFALPFNLIQNPPRYNSNVGTLNWYTETDQEIRIQLIINELRLASLNP